MGVVKEGTTYRTECYGNPEIRATFTGTLNAWNRCEVVVDYDANTATYYLNGTLVGTNSLTTSSYNRVHMGAGSSGPGGGTPAVYYDMITVQKTR